MKNSLSDYLQIWGFDEDNIIFSDGSYGFGLEVIPLDVSCWSPDAVNEFSNKVVQFLNGLPSGVDLQFIQDITSGNRTVIEEHELTSSACQNEIVAELTQVRAQRLKDLDSVGMLPKHSLKVFVRKSAQSNLLEKPKFFSKKKNFQEIADEKLQFELHSLERLKTDLITSLEQLGLQSDIISIEGVINLIYKQWNPSRSIDRAAFDPDDVRSSLLFTDVGINDRGFSLSDYHYRVISLKLLPDQTFATMASTLRSLPFDSRLQLTIHVPDQQKELESLQVQRRIAYSMIAGRRSGVSDLDSEAKFRDLEGLLEQMVSQGEKVFHMSLQVILKAKTAEELDDLVSQALMKIRDMSGAEGMEESLAAFEIFSEVAIPNARSKERVKRIKGSNLCDLLPLYGPWPGHSEAKILLRSRLGSLVKFNPFSSDLTNANQIVSGGSGSGKSFLTNILLIQMLKENPKVFIVDIGGSYKKICDNLDGQYIPLGVDSNFSINPFDLLPGEKIPSNQKIKFILSLVEIMTKEENEPRLGRLERAEIENAIQDVYMEFEKPRLSNLRDKLLKHSDPQIIRYGKILGPWCGDSPFGRFVDRETTIELTRPIVCFDLKGMETLPDLQATCLFIITDFVWREVQANRSKMKFLIFDECWKLLENDSGALFIAEVFRTFRKYLASAIAISQNIDDFAKSKIATAILPNASIKWVLKQKGADQERLKTVLSLNENEVAQIVSLHQERGIYSEAFLMAEDKRAVVAIESTPLEYWLATTDPRDLSKIETEKKNSPQLKILEVLKQLATNYPRGVAAGEIR
jgi:conjugal transfer ATP-binding protein TraC